MKKKGLVALLGLAIAGVCAGVVYRKHRLDKKVYGLDSMGADEEEDLSSFFNDEGEEDVFTEEEDDLDGLFD